MNEHDLKQLRRAGQRMGLRREALEEWVAAQSPVAGPEPTVEPAPAAASVEDPAPKKTTKKASKKKASKK